MINTEHYKQTLDIKENAIIKNITDNAESLPLKEVTKEMTYKERLKIEKENMQKYGITYEQRQSYSKKSQQIYDNIPAIDYPQTISELLGKINDVLKNKKNCREGKKFLEVDEDFWKLYCGIPTTGKYITVSDYKPRQSKENIIYYDIENILNKQMIVNYVLGHTNINGSSRSEENKDANGFHQLRYKEELLVDLLDPLHHFKLDKGEDENGYYVSYYDIYDFNQYEGIVGKKYEIYGRIYYSKDGKILNI